MKNYIKLSITGIILSLILSLAIGCRGTNDSVESQEGPASVKVILKGEDFSDTGNIGAQASSGRNSTGSAAETEQRQEIALKNNNDYKIVATLTPVKSVNTSQASSKANLIAATETNPLPNGTRYKVVVFDNSGNYLTEQDYVVGQAVADITGLDGGSAYTFIVYSIGSSTDLPIVTYVDPLNKTLATASVNNVSGDSDLMYFSKTMTVSGNGTNYLDTVLRHRFSQVTTTIDASPTQIFKITSITNPIIHPHFNGASLQLSNGSVTSSGGSQKNVTFPPLNNTAVTVTSDPVLINPMFETANQSDMVFTIENLILQTDDPLSAQITHQFVTSRFRVGRGIKYNLNLSIIPNDKYLTFRGYPAVKINGVIYMRHNLGANTLNDPDVLSPDLIGNYYQWGRNMVVANASTGTGAIPGWNNSTLPPANAWNIGTLAVPQKNTTNDPCPNGWRVMSRRDYHVLINSTNYTIIGNAASTDPSSAAGVSTSKFNSAVKLTFPFAGVRRGEDGAFAITIGPGSEITGNYWTSSFDEATNTSPIFARFYSINDPGAFIASISPRMFTATSMRCVAEYPYTDPL
ncbi:hypothetical protein VO54_03865 [Elizabethkingia miricola]|nr:hypothetical protein VO54_03865 [Elizabethkingia miricola]